MSEKAKAPEGETSWFAVYDTAHLRFVGEVTGKKSDATKTAKDLTEKTGRTHEVREV